MERTTAASLAARLDALPVNRWHWRLLALCAAGMGFDLFDTQIIANVVPKLVHEWHINDTQVGLISSASFAGMLIGTLLFGMVADKIGRRKVFIITLLWYSLITGTLALTSNVTQMVVMRFIEGLGLGGFVPVATAYLAEYVPSKRRGQFVALFAGSAMVSYCFSFVVGFLIIVPYGWKWAFVLGIVPCLLVVSVLRDLPESVRYLTKTGKLTEAVELVEQLEQRILGSITVPHAEALRAVTRSESEEPKVRYRDLFRGGLARTVLMLSFLGFAFNFANYAIRMWIPILFLRELNVSLSFGFKINAVATFIAVSGQVIAGWTCDHWGRRPSLAYSFIGYGIFSYLIFLAGKSYPMTAWVCIFLFHINNGAAWGALYPYLSENFPTRIRATGVAFAQSVGRFGGILGPIVVGLIYSRFGIQWVLHLNMVLLCAAVGAVYLLGYETKLKSLEDISRMQAGDGLAGEPVSEMSLKRKADAQ